MNATREIGTAFAVIAVLAITACAQADALPPQPSQSASPPASVPSSSPTDQPVPDRLPPLSDLVITPAGIGSLLIGHSVTETDMVVFDADFCAGSEEMMDPSAELGRWVANYPGESLWDVPFSAHVTDDKVTIIETFSSKVPTAEGIRVGSSLAELDAAYPELTPGADGPLSRTFLLSTAAGEVVFELPAATIHDESFNGAYEEFEPDTVFKIQVRGPDAHTEDPTFLSTSFATDNAVGGC